MAQPRHPEYMTHLSRKESFSLWPISMRQKPDDMVEAGFYYTSRGDFVFCYYCGLCVRDWEVTDDPWFEHARWNSTCPYLVLLKGQSFIDNVKQEMLVRTAMKDLEHGENLESKNQVTVKSDTGSESNTVHDNLCKICLERELRLVFLPCGHFCACLTCGLQVNACPICRGQVKSVVKVFMS
jgi:baculoviral IAP repeat-containing protein 7/8